MKQYDFFSNFRIRGTSLITFLKSFIRPNLDYRDIIYDRKFITSFH